MEEFLLKENELDILINEIFTLLPNGGVVLLRGNLASGKTTLVKKVANFLHVSEDLISSPTFSILNIYKDGFYHYDIYSDGLDKMLANGLFENLTQEGYHFVEWGNKDLEKLLKEYEMSYIVVEIEVKNNKRLYKVF